MLLICSNTDLRHYPITELPHYQEFDPVGLALRGMIDSLSVQSGSIMLSAHTKMQGKYRIIRQLGQGGMGAVYEAVDERLDTIVALKETLFY